MLTKELKLYHRRVFIPENIKNPLSGKYVRALPSRTAIEAAKGMRVKLPQFFNLDTQYLVEVGVADDGAVKHITYRQPWRIKEELFFGLAVDLKTGQVVIKKVWAAPASCEHYTIDARRYVQSPTVKPPRSSCRHVYRDSGFVNSIQIPVVSRQRNGILR